MKNLLLRSFLAVSIVFSVFLVSNCDDLLNHLPVFPGHGADTSNPPEFGGSESSSYATSLFKSVAEGAAGEIGGSAASWALSAIGLSEGSPDYTEQLDKIDQDLQVIIGQLNGIQNELTQINQELNVINCSEWASSLKDEKSIVDNLMEDYQTFISTASNGDTVSNVTISDWVDQVLAINSYSSQESMGKVLTAFSGTLFGPANSGVIPSCVQAISYIPPDNSFGTDTVYYNQVKLFTDYYYAYQVKALFLYSEAKHYQAWVSAGSPNSDYLSADSVSYVCSNGGAKVICNDVATRTNSLYNALINQLTAGGAPYSDDNFVLMYDQQNPYMWPKSLEDFTVAAGDNCTDPLTSANPCGVTANFYDESNVDNVLYKGYTGWSEADKQLLINLLAGWTSGTAGDYLQNNLDFKNMKNKVIISTNTVSISLNETYKTQYVVPFFDTDWNYNFLPGGGGPAITEIQYREGPLVKSRTEGGLCSGLVYYYESIDYKTSSKVPQNRNNFYNASGHARICQNHDEITTPFSWSVIPGYVGYQVEWINDSWTNVPNHETSARQYLWPVRTVSDLTCTDNRSIRNAGGIWTMCGNDFTAWLEYNVPRPETCDNSGAGVKCIVTGETVANAKNAFGDNSKGQKRL